MVGVTPLVDEFAEDIWYDTRIRYGEPPPAGGGTPSADAEDEPRTADTASVLGLSRITRRGGPVPSR